MRDNKLQFGAVREDPRVERSVLREFGCQRPLLIASAGCTALAVASWFPEVALTAIDPNPAQLRHVRAKQEALQRRAPLSEHCELAERGNFESLFRMLREFVHDLVLPRSEWLAFFVRGGPNPLDRLASTRYWPLAFELAFADELLVAMFGGDAVQHAAPGSYPGYFRKVFEDGLQREDARRNPFLHHVFLGHYLPDAPPDYLEAGGDLAPIELLEASIRDVDLGDYDFIGLSNVLDWMGEADVEALMGDLVSQTRPGTVVLWRQLNNDRPLFEHLQPTFDHIPRMGESLRARDRSLFYRRIHVCHRR